MLYRVWADGTVQEVDGSQPYPWLSDDYAFVEAESEEDAWDKFVRGKYANP